MPFEGEAFKVTDKQANVFYEEAAKQSTIESAAAGGRPEIDRAKLSNLLFHSLRPDSVRWGHKLMQAVPLEHGRHELQFENGHTDQVDLVVAADGAFSRIRPLLSGENAAYSGVSMIELNIMNAAAHFPELAAFNGTGSMFALDDQKTIMAQFNGDDRIRVYLGFAAERDWLDNNGLDYTDPASIKHKLLSLFEDWSQELKNYILHANGPITPRRIYMLPVGHRWENKPGVTLIGDAAHLMSPFAGAGANLAMLDAAELGEMLINDSDLNQAVQAYELKMFEYAGELAAETQTNMALFFSDQAAQKLGEKMKTLIGRQ